MNFFLINVSNNRPCQTLSFYLGIQGGHINSEINYQFVNIAQIINVSMARN